MQKQRRKPPLEIYGLQCRALNITLPGALADKLDQAPNRSKVIRDALTLYYAHRNEVINVQQQ